MEAWASTVANLAESHTTLNKTGVIRSLSRIALFEDGLDPDASQKFSNLVDTYSTLSAAFPVLTKVWWEFKAIRDDAKTLQSIDDVLRTFKKDRRYIYYPSARRYLDPPSEPSPPGTDALDNLRKAMVIGEGALAVVDGRLEKAKMKLRVLKSRLDRDPRFEVDDDTGLDRLSSMYFDSCKASVSD